MAREDHAMIKRNRIVSKEVLSELPMNHHFAVDQVVKEIISPGMFNKMMESILAKEKATMNVNFLKKTNHSSRK